MGNEEEIKINGKVVTKEELEAKKEEVAKMPGTKLVESAANDYKLQIKG